MTAFDPRIVRIGIEIEGETSWYEGLDIKATGVRYGSDINNPCQIRIDNLTAEHRNYILTKSSPYIYGPNSRYLRPRVYVFAGRQSYGTSLIYSGIVLKSFVSQPPEISVVLNCVTALDTQLETVSYATGPEASMKSIAEKGAEILGVSLNFQATDKKISNFTISSDANAFVRDLSQVGNINVTLDNNILTIVDEAEFIAAPAKLISQSTGMIGIPEWTEDGVLVKYLLDNNTFIFQEVTIESILNPAINGPYKIFKLGFDITSRDVPFYWIAECVRPAYVRTN